MTSHATALLSFGGLVVAATAAAVAINSAEPQAQREYVGQETCMSSGCHAGAFHDTSDYQGAAPFRQTLHQMIHLRPSPETVIIEKYFAGDSVLRFIIPQAPIPGQDTLLIYLSKEGGDYYAQMRISGGDSTSRLKVEYTYGGHGWIQRYLVRVGESFFVLPFQYVLPGYRDRSPEGGAFYYLDVQRWLGIDAGVPLFLPVNSEEFKAFAYDRECAECHVNGFDLTRRISGVDTSYIASWVGKAEGDSALQDQNIKIGCETCHGPGSEHVANPVAPGSIFNPRDLPSTQESWQLRLDACNFCHARTRSTHETFRYPYDETGDRPYVPGQPLAGFVNDMFKHMNNWPDGVTSYAHRQMGQDYIRGDAHHDVFPNSCYDCHSAHTQGMPGMPYQLKRNFYSLTNGEGCVSCHGSAGPTMNPPLENMLLTGTRGGRTVNVHTQHSPEVSQCVNCHMTKTASIAFIELARKPLYEFSDHSFRVIRPTLTRDMQTSLIGMINTCAASCHRNGRGSRNLVDTLPAAPDFGIVDPHLGTWKEATDVELADSLWYHYQRMFARFVTGVRVSDAVAGAGGIASVAPAPFTTTTTVRYTVARQGDVALEVYDLRGRRQRTLAAGMHQPGIFVATWDGTDELGEPLGAGSYLIRLRGPDGATSRTIQLLR